MSAHPVSTRDKKKKKLRIMKEFQIREVSAVDVPAQSGAEVVLMKRLDGDDESFEKKTALTDEVEGFAHLVQLTFDEVEINSGHTSWADDHQHPWIRTETGEIIIGIANNHFHVIVEIGKRTFTSDQREELVKEGKALPDGSFPIVNKNDLRNAIQSFGRAKNKARVAKHIAKRAKALNATDLLPETGLLASALNKSVSTAGTNETETEEDIIMPDPVKKTAAETKQAEQIEVLEKKLKTMENLSSLTDIQKNHYGLLGDSEKETFLGKSSDERDAEIESLKSADPVVYKSADGTEYRKSDGASVTNLAKKFDKANAKLEKMTEEVEDNRLAKRAEELLGSLPGDTATHISMLKAIDGIVDKDQREAALKSLQAQNTQMAKAFETQGHSSVSIHAGNAEQELDSLAKSYAKDHKVTEAEAYNKVLDTPEGNELYNQTVSN